MTSTHPRNVAILGSGGMGTALALLFARSADRVRLWGRDPHRADLIQKSRENTLHLPGVSLPENVLSTGDAATACEGSDLVVAAIPTAFLRQTLTKISGSIPKDVCVLSVIKGIEIGTFARPSEVIRSVLGERPVAVLSGPSHAEEMARGLPASVVVASDDEGLNLWVQKALNGPGLRIYTNSDMLGVEMAGALKNILGVAAGICDGLGFGDNAKAALLTRGLIEIARFACEMGARPSTFMGLAGVGDVITTCYSPFGRNRAVGVKIGTGETLDRAVSGMANVAEGVTTARSVHDLAASLGVAMPITDEVYRILHEDKPPRAAVADLMQRLPKDEWP